MSKDPYLGNNKTPISKKVPNLPNQKKNKMVRKNRNKIKRRKQNLNGNNNIKLSETTLNFIDAVINPFGAQNPAQVPDLCSFNSLCLTDRAESTSYVNATAGNISGVLCIARFGYSNEHNARGSIPGLIYSLMIYGINSSNNLVTNNAVTTVSEILPINYSKICGNLINFDNNVALVTKLRVFAMGLRVWPTIETITDSATNAIDTIYSAQLSMNEIDRAFGSTLDIYNVIKQANNVKSFTNNAGACSRYNPFQDEFQLRPLPLANANNSSVSFAGYYCPCIVVKFRNVVAAGSTIPAKIYSNYWIEGEITEPTPIYSTRSPVDIFYKEISAILSREDATPLVCEGHTFKSVWAIMKSLMGSFRNVIKFSSRMIDAYDAAART
jgi:hypothetical protein